MQHLSKRWLFGLFFLSGFSALVCQIVWLRLAFAAFGVVTPVISVLLSAFMLGLGLGSWAAGLIVKRWPWGWSTALRAYAGAEFMIGVGALCVPVIFNWGEHVLLPAGETDSASYLAYSALVMFLALTPFCVCMGLTFPFMLQAVRADHGAPTSFSFLYLANVIGAVCGTLAAPFVLVELWGFQATLWIAAFANWLAAASSFVLSTRSMATAAINPNTAQSAGDRERKHANAWGSGLTLTILFTTGLSSMANEVVWNRAYAPVVTTQVYWFAGFLFAYLLATWLGSWLYRWQLARGRVFSAEFVLAMLALFAFGQLLLADPRIKGSRISMQLFWLLAGIGPYCAILGYLTPKLIDEYSFGSPASAGRAYAVNVLGCIIGPLMASYILLPYVGVQYSGILLGLPLWVLAGITLQKKVTPAKTSRAPVFVWGAATIFGILAGTVGQSRELQHAGKNSLILRDHTATVIADEKDGEKRLLVNSTPITVLKPVTKHMAHFPLCHLEQKPRSILVICFGMGTTYRAGLSWDIETTAVELAPSVRDAFGYFYADAADARKNPHGRIVIDDGRRFLRRTTERFDVITIDPPPPVEAAGSSLLYSREFYDLIKLRLSDQGILQQWYPGGDKKIFQAALRSIVESFPHVRVMHGFEGAGFHILAAMHPIPRRSTDELISSLPEKARQDLVELSEGRSAASMFQSILESEFHPAELLDSDLRVMITDDRPYNEYCLLRRLREWRDKTHVTLQ